MTFKVPPHQFKYLAKPNLGDVVTFEFESFSRSEIPKNPKICRIRKDVEWEEVLSNYARDSAQAKYLNGTTSLFYCSPPPFIVPASPPSYPLLSVPFLTHFISGRSVAEGSWLLSQDGRVLDSRKRKEHEEIPGRFCQEEWIRSLVS